VPASGADGAASEDGAGQNNPVWSEGPWGRAAAAARTEVLQHATSPGTERGSDEGSGSTKDNGKPTGARDASNGKAWSDIPALKPYWGKPAVRNFREGNGNVGIIRSPLRAFALPDQSNAAGFTSAIQLVWFARYRSATIEYAQIARYNARHDLMLWLWT
jgi:hypothetical protein